MSHFAERKEKDCLNCGTIVTGHFCQNCGQRNAEPKESFGHMLRHFFEDLTHFDGSFFATFKVMLTKPGFVTEEYVRGRRASYLNPIRMYLFVSAMFFLLHAAFIRPQEKKNDAREKLVEAKEEAKNKTSQNAEAVSILMGLKHVNTVAQYDSLQEALPDNLKDNFVTKKTNRNFFKTIEENLAEGDTSGALATKNSLMSMNAQWIGVDDSTKIAINGTPLTISRNKRMATSVHEYDSIQKVLPKDKRDGPVQGYFMRKIAAVNEHGKDKDEHFGEKIGEKFRHSLPYMLFVTVPLVALLLKLLYVRRKEYYYVSHLIFTIHFYCFVFVSMMLIDTFDLFDGWGEIIGYILRVGLALYLYWAMRRFYKQRRAKTIFKFSLFLTFGLLLIGFMTTIFAAVALFSVV